MALLKETFSAIGLLSFFRGPKRQTAGTTSRSRSMPQIFPTRLCPWICPFCFPSPLSRPFQISHHARHSSQVPLHPPCAQTCTAIFCPAGTLASTFPACVAPAALSLHPYQNQKSCICAP